MNANTTIRPCQAGDLAAVSDLLRQLDEVAHARNGLTLEELAGLWRQMETAPGFYLNLVAADGDRVVGFISVIFYKTLFHRGGTALINELVVDQATRGRGIGRALIEGAIAAARHRGMDEIEVSTEHENRAAQAFYQRCGFAEEYVLLGMEFD